jgi:hypothetical protein
MTDAEFEALLQSSRAEFIEKPRRLQFRIAGAKRWFYDLASSSITFDDQSYPILAIWTFNPTRMTWLLGWANKDFPSTAHEGSSVIRSLYDVTNFRVISDPGTRADAQDAEASSAMAVHLVGAIGLCG